MTWEAASAGGLCLYVREARQSGKPMLKYTVRSPEAGLLPEAVLYRTGKPDSAGGHY